MRLKKLAAIGTTVLFAALAYGCNGTTDDPGTTNPPDSPPETSTALRPAESCEPVRTQIVESTTEKILEYRYRRRGYAAAGADSSNSSDRSTNESSSGKKESPDDYTQTNTQEEGVDEADIVKTDGNFIYTVDDDEFVILKSWPAEETSVVGRYKLGSDSDDTRSRNLSARSLFLRGDRAVVFSSAYGRYGARYRSYSNATRISVFDVSDRTNPKPIKQLEIDGTQVSGRMIDGDVYLVTNSRVSTPIDVWEIASSENEDLPPRNTYNTSEEERRERVREARPKIREIVRDRLADTSIPEMLPERRRIDDNGNMLWKEPLYSCRDLYVPTQKAQLGVLNISHFNFDTPEEVTTTGLLADGWTVYASQKNLYIAQSSRFWSWGWGWNDREDESHIHKFSIDGAYERPRYAASGSVDGWLLDQFAMDEHEGYLRVASTESGSRWGVPEDEREESKNHLTVLEQKGHELEEVGSVRGLAKGERIYAVRMMGDKGYIVTFRQIDPLFTLDLSNPRNPEVEGELKITGFSNYIHPLGEDYLMTIGQDADQEGRVQGVQLQIFDVGDMENPTRIHQERISTDRWSSWSEAMWNHHAFTYHPERDVLAFPINIRDWERNGGDDFSGLLVYEANAEDGFTPIGRVSHGDLSGDHRWWTTVRRSIFIEDYVYSLSERGMKVNDLRAPRIERAAVPF